MVQVHGAEPREGQDRQEVSVHCLITTPRNFRNIVSFVHRRVASMPPDLIVSLWHRAVLHLYEYLVYKPL